MIDHKTLFFNPNELQAYSMILITVGVFIGWVMTKLWIDVLKEEIKQLKKEIESDGL